VGVYVTVRCPSVYPSVCKYDAIAGTGLLLWAGPGGQEISIDCCAACAHQQRAVGECGQCQVVSVRRKQNADLIVNITFFVFFLNFLEFVLTIYLYEES